MKNYDRFLAAVKISGCILFWLLFCSMFTQCEKNRALAEGNDVEFSIVQTGRPDVAAEYYSDYVDNLVFKERNFSFDAPLFLSPSEDGSSINLLVLSVVLWNNEPLAAQKVYSAGDGLTDLNISVSYQVNGSGETFVGRLEDAALKISLLSGRYATGIFSGVLDTGSERYRIDDGYYNIKLTE